MTTQNELARLEGIISRDISSFIKRKCTLDQDLFDAFKQALHEETERVKGNLAQAVFNHRKKRSLEMYIQYHEQAIIRLSGYLTRYVPPRKINTLSRSLDDALLCKQLYHTLQELLEFVNKHFPEYFDKNAWIPESYKLIVQHEVRRNIVPLRLGLLKKGFKNSLVDLALSPLKDFLKENSTTYRKVAYLKELQRELLLLIADEKALPECDTDAPLQLVLFRMNFNTVAHFNFCIQNISSFIDSAESPESRIEKLALVQKVIHQEPVKSGLSYEPNNKPLKTQLADWIKQEIIFTEAKLMKKDPQLETKEPEEFEKVKVNLSVAQGSYFLRVFVEGGVIQSDNVASLIRKAARTFETKRSETVSRKSVENRYYDVEYNTRQSVRAMLLGLVKYIDDSEA